MAYPGGFSRGNMILSARIQEKIKKPMENEVYVLGVPMIPILGVVTPGTQSLFTSVLAPCVLYFDSTRMAHGNRGVMPYIIQEVPKGCGVR